VAHLGFSKVCVWGGTLKKALVDQVIETGDEAPGRPRQGATWGLGAKPPWQQSCCLKVSELFFILFSIFLPPPPP